MSNQIKRTTMRTIFSLAVALLLSVCAKAQVKVTEPEFIGQIAILTSDSTCVTLQKEKSVMKTKSTKFGYIPLPGASLLDKTKTKLVLDGNAASNTFKSGTIRFIMRVEKQEIDPTTYLRIAKFEVKKKTRESVMAQFGIVQGMKMDMNSSESFEVQKYGNNSLLFTLHNVEPGQYGISFTGLLDASTFGVE